MSAGFLNVALVVLLILGLSVAAWASRRRFKKGSACCGEREDMPRVKVEDKNPSHYPHQVVLKIQGMTCENCVRRVESALAGLEGAWPKVSLDKKEAVVRLKNPPQEESLRRAVAGAGYVVTEIKLVR